MEKPKNLYTTHGHEVRRGLNTGGRVYRVEGDKGEEKYGTTVIA